MSTNTRSATSGTNWAKIIDTNAGLEVKNDTNFLGNFVATNHYSKYVQENTADTWANAKPPVELTNCIVNDLAIGEAIKLAHMFDGDIDGKANSGTSSCKEGSESFIFGANYSGTRGVAISEVSGVSASYVRGKRVSWLDGDSWSYQEGGDSWSYQKGGDSHSESDRKDISSKVVAESFSSKTESSGSINVESSSVKNNTSLRLSAANVATINIGTTTSETIIFAACTNLYSGILKLTLNCGLNFNTVNLIALATETNFIGLKRITEYIAKISLSSQNAPLSAKVIKGIDSRVSTAVTQVSGSLNLIADNKIEKYTNVLNKLEVAMNSSEKFIEDLTTSMRSVNISMGRANTCLKKKKILVEENGAVVGRVNVAVLKSSTVVNSAEYNINA